MSEILFKKIKWQTIVLVAILFFFGYLLLRINNSIDSPQSITGLLLIGSGLLYSVWTFIVVIISEHYEKIIKNYSSLAQILRSGHKDMEKSLKETLTASTNDNKIGGYTKENGLQNETNDS